MGTTIREEIKINIENKKADTAAISRIIYNKLIDEFIAEYELSVHSIEDLENFVDCKLLFLTNENSKDIVYYREA